jgi:cytochrome P450
VGQSSKVVYKVYGSADLGKSGPHTCAGKQMALNELRLATALTIDRFVVTLGNNYDEKTYLEEWKDYWTVKLGKLPVVLTPRE